MENKEKKTAWFGVMNEFRRRLDSVGIVWWDVSDDNEWYTIYRTHFHYRGYEWSVIIGYGSFGEEQLKLELMSDAVNGGEPIGYLQSCEAMRLVLNGEEDEEISEEKAVEIVKQLRSFCRLRECDGCIFFHEPFYCDLEGPPNEWRVTKGEGDEG